MSYLLEIAIILILIVINGIFAMAEFSLVSAKKTCLQHLADEGDTRAAVALEIMREPTRFLSTVHGIFAVAFGGATVAREFAAYLAGVPPLAPYSDILSIVIVVLVITYLTLIFGVLVPKRLALNNAESIASSVAKPHAAPFPADLTAGDYPQLFY